MRARADEAGEALSDGGALRVRDLNTALAAIARRGALHLLEHCARRLREEDGQRQEHGRVARGDVQPVRLSEDREVVARVLSRVLLQEVHVLLREVALAGVEAAALSAENEEPTQAVCRSDLEDVATCVVLHLALVVALGGESGLDHVAVLHGFLLWKQEWHPSRLFCLGVPLSWRHGCVNGVGCVFTRRKLTDTGRPVTKFEWRMWGCSSGG